MSDGAEQGHYCLQLILSEPLHPLFLPYVEYVVQQILSDSLKID